MPFKNFTEEDRAAAKKKRLEKKSKLSLAFQLGYYVGEQIIDKFLPTLSVDMLKTKKNISVTCAEGDECRRLNNIWFNKRISIKGSDEEQSKATEKEWNDLRAYHEMLEEKYLPKTIECHLGRLNINENDMIEFKKGISDSLWNCDCSHYSTDVEDIEVKEDDGWFTVITLKRHVDN